MKTPKRNGESEQQQKQRRQKRSKEREHEENLFDGKRCGAS